MASSSLARQRPIPFSSKSSSPRFLPMIPLAQHTFRAPVAVSETTREGGRGRERRRTDDDDDASSGVPLSSALLKFSSGIVGKSKKRKKKEKRRRRRRRRLYPRLRMPRNELTPPRLKARFSFLSTCVHDETMMVVVESKLIEGGS